MPKKGVTKHCQEEVSISSPIENQIDLSLPRAINLCKYVLMTTSLLIPFIHPSSHMTAKASTVHGKAYVSSELHKQGDLLKFLILGHVFLPGHINGKETRIKLDFAIFFLQERNGTQFSRAPLKVSFLKKQDLCCLLSSPSQNPLECSSVSGVE